MIFQATQDDIDEIKRRGPGNIIQFRPRPEPEEPTATGPAKCIRCKHEYTATAPMGVFENMECPACGVMAARFEGIYRLPDGVKQWECACGNDLFKAMEGGTFFCVNCGRYHDAE